jgi:hypothetical protein
MAMGMSKEQDTHIHTLFAELSNLSMDYKRESAIGDPNSMHIAPPKKIFFSILSSKTKGLIEP